MIFKKRKDRQNKIKSSGRKKSSLILSLLFGKPRLSFSRSSSSNLENQVVQERVIEEREFNSLLQCLQIKIGSKRLNLIKI